MANEVAALGIKVDASDVKSGGAALDDFAAKGVKVENAMDGVEKSAAKTGKSLKTMGVDGAKGLQDIAAAAPKVAASFGGIAKSAEDAQKALAGINSSLAGLGKVSDTANQAANGLAGFTRSLAESKKSLSDMQAQVREASLAANQMGSAFANARASVQSSAASQSAVAKSTSDMGAAYKTAGDQVNAYAKAPEAAASANQRVAKSMDVTATAANSLKSAMAVVGLSFGAQELIAMVDGYTKFSAQLRLATNSAASYASAMDSVKRISKDAQQGLNEVGTLYARIANGTAELGLSQQKLSAITEVVALSLKASGATASEASSAMLQLSQAFASGVLRGEEFNAVNEAAPRLMKALADGIGQPVGALRKMAEEGKLTAEVLANALPRALEEVRVEAAKMQTIGGSFTVLKNSMMEFFGTTSQASGAVSTITKSVELLAENLNLVTAAALGFGATKLATFLAESGKKAIENTASTAAYVASLNQQRAAAIASAQAEASVSAARVAGLTSLTAKLAAERQAALADAASATSLTVKTNALMAASVAELNLTRTTAQLTAATTAQTIAQSALSGAITATSTAATVASRALALVGGPIGLITTALGLGVTAWMTWGNSSETAANQAKNAVASGHHEILSRLDDQIRKLRERAGLLASGNTAAASEDTAESAKLASLNAQIEGMKKRSAELTGVEQIGLIELQGQYVEINNRLKEQARLKGEIVTKTNEASAISFLAANEDGITQKFLDQVAGYDKALAANLITTDKYRESINRLNKERIESTAAAKEAAKQDKSGASAAKSANQELEKQASLLAELSGLSSSFYKDWDGLNKQYAQGRISLKGLEEAQAALLAKQPAMVALAKEELDISKARIKAWEEEVKGWQKLVSERNKDAESAEEALRKAKDEEIAHQLAATASITHAEAVARLALARSEDNYQKALSKGSDGEILLALQRETEARRGLVEVMQQKGVREANEKAAQQITKDWEKTSQTIGSSLSDYIMGGGKNAAQYLKRLFANLVLEPVVKGLVGNVLGGLSVGASGSGDILGSLSSLKTLYSSFTGGIASTLGGAIGKLGSAFGSSALSSFSAGMTGGIGAATPVGMGIGASGAIGGSSAAASAGATAAKALPVVGWIATGMLAAKSAYDQGYTEKDLNWANPIGLVEKSVTRTLTALGISDKTAHILSGASLTAKIFDKLGLVATPHMGAGAIYSGGQTQEGASIYNKSTFGLGVEKEYAASAQAAISSVAASAGVTLDAVAKTFDLATGYSVSTAFADDRSKDGAWGSLKIADELGRILVNWADTQAREGVPKEFADGQEGYTQYLNAVQTDVLTAIQGMNIAGWAKDIFKAAEGAEGLQKAMLEVSQAISAFKVLGETMEMFSGLTGEFQTRLFDAAGGIEALTASSSSFYEGFFSEEERAQKQRELQMKALGQLGLYIDPYQGDAAKESFRKTVEEAMASGQAEMAAQLLAMSAAFASTADYGQKLFDDMEESAKDAAEESKKAAEEAAEAAELLAEQALELSNAWQSLGVTMSMFSGLTEDMKSRLLSVAGTMEVLASGVEAFNQGFYSEQERALRQRESQMAALAGMGLYIDPAEGEKAKELFRKTVEEAMSSGQAELAAKLLAMSGEFSATADYAKQFFDQLSQSAVQSMSTAWSSFTTVAGLAAQYTGNTSGLSQQLGVVQGSYANATSTEGRVGALQQIISLEQALWNGQQEARQAEAAAASARANAAREQLNSAKQLLSAAQSLGQYAKSIGFSEASGLSEADRLVNLERERISLLARANAGDTEAMQELQSVTGSYLTLAEGLSSSQEAYSLLSGRIAAELEATSAIQAASASSQVSQFEQQIAVAESVASSSAAQFTVSTATQKLIDELLIESSESFASEAMMTQKLIDQGVLTTSAIQSLPAEIAGAIGSALIPAILALAAGPGAVSAASIPQFASGGDHFGGLRIVGENGWEVESTGPSRIFNQSQLADAFSGGNESAALMNSLISELRAEKGDQRVFYGEQIRVSSRTARILEMWNLSGLPEEREQEPV